MYIGNPHAWGSSEPSAVFEIFGLAAAMGTMPKAPNDN